MARFLSPHACHTPCGRTLRHVKDANRPARTEQLFRRDDKKQMRGPPRGILRLAARMVCPLSLAGRFHRVYDNVKDSSFASATPHVRPFGDSRGRPKTKEPR